MTQPSPPTHTPTGSDKTARRSVFAALGARLGRVGRRFGAPDAVLRRRLWAAWAVVAFERLWPRLWPASGIVGGFLALALSGLLPLLPWPLHALILAGFVTAICLALTDSLRGFAWPSRRDGARKLETDSGLAHRPISESEDRLAAGRGDAMSEALWLAHRHRSIDPAALHLGLPHAGLAGRDPRAVRFVVLVAVGFGFLLAWGGWDARLMSAFGPTSYESPGLDAWIEPPAYTGAAPIYLSGEGTIAAPAGSVLKVRVHGATHAPFLSLSSTHFPYLSLAGIRLDGDGGEFSGGTVLKQDATIRLRADGRTLSAWSVHAVPDLAPSIAFTAKPSGTERAALKIAYTAHDDYGVSKVRAFIRPTDGKGNMLVLDLGAPAGKDVAETSIRDLTDQPYAGSEVDIVLVAEDASGHIAVSTAMRTVLPALHFSDPLAKALVEQRKALMLQGMAARGQVMRVLDALAIAPELFYAGRSSIYLAVRSAYWGLKNAAGTADLVRIEALLWQTAAALEAGGTKQLAADLRRLQQQLAQMMASGAPQEDIDAVMNRYESLLERYLSELARNTPDGKGVADENAKRLGLQDLADLMNAIQTLSQSGDHERAAELLAFLQNLIENMRVSSGEGGQGESQALKDLSEVMGKQRRLLDKTYRETQGAGDPADGGGAGLSRQQDALKNQLGGVLKGLKKPPEDLTRAEKLMGDARDALATGDLPRAGTLQKYVLEALRKSANGMAAAKGGAKPGDDPLGRSADGKNGGDIKLPDASSLRRTRDILNELRRRSGEMGRPKEERDYIDRLLKRF